MNKILLILKKELREVFRDKKSLAMMLIVPIMIPLIVIGISALFELENEKDIETYNKIGFNYEISEVEQNILKQLNIEYFVYDNDKLVEEFASKNINAYITKEDNKYVINYDVSNIESSYAQGLAEGFLEAYKSVLENNYLANANVNIDEYNNLLLYETKTIEQENFFANYITNYAFLFIIMAITISATYPATDTTAGEKERGTLETLLTFPIKTKDIIIGKLLSVTISSLITGFLSLILSIASLIYINNTFTIFEGTTLINLPMIITSIVVIIAYSLLISGLCIAVASMSKTFKEAQSALTPLTFVSFFPGMIVMLLNISNSLILSIIPFVNFSMIFDDVINNNFNVLYIIAMFVSTIVYIIIVINYIIKQYTSEKVLFSK